MKFPDWNEVKTCPSELELSASSQPATAASPTSTALRVSGRRTSEQATADPPGHQSDIAVARYRSTLTANGFSR